MSMSQEILNLLNNLEETLKCAICKNKISDPMRIKICGHYFCKICITHNSNLECPQCNETYKRTDLCEGNIAKSTEILRLELRTLLESSDDEGSVAINDTCDESNVIPSSYIPRYTNKTVQYNGKQYKINFVNINHIKINSKGENSLHLACKKTDLNEVKRIVKNCEIDLNAKDHAGWTPLHEAIEIGGVETAKYLIECGCLIDIPGSDFITPLFQAVILSNTNIVKLLLEHNADKGVIDYFGKKVIEVTNNSNIIKLLQTQKPTKTNRIFNLYLPSEICVYCHSIDKLYVDLLTACKHIHIEKNMDPGNKTKITHFVVKETHKLSFKILQAILQGYHFITQNYVQKLIDGEYLMNENVFTSPLNHLNSTIKTSAFNALLKLPQLFEGMFFYIESHSVPSVIYNLKVDKNYLIQLIEVGGGKVLRRPPALRTCEGKIFHPFFAQNSNSHTFTCCHYIIYPEENQPELTYNMAEILHRSSKWLIDCIIKYEVLD